MRRRYTINPTSTKTFSVVQTPLYGVRRCAFRLHFIQPSLRIAGSTSVVSARALAQRTSPVRRPCSTLIVFVITTTTIDHYIIYLRSPAVWNILSYFNRQHCSRACRFCAFRLRSFLSANCTFLSVNLPVFFSLCFTKCLYIKIFISTLIYF